MDKHEFLKKIDSLKDCAADTRVLELYEAAEEIFGGHEDETRDLKSEINQLEENKSKHEDEVHDYVQQIEALEKDSRFTLVGIHDNIATSLAIESLFENLDFIPVHELESFINKHKKN